MASRGRGRGKVSMSISTEQMGFGKGDALPPPVLQPPVKYPPLDYKPAPSELTTELCYLLEIKQDFAEYIRESPFSVQSVIVKKDIERFSDRYQDMVTDKASYGDRYDWNRLPEELKPGLRKRSAAGKTIKDLTKKKKLEKKDVDIETKLQELEQKEDRQQSDVEEDSKAEPGGEEKDETEAGEGEEAEEIDEEMEDDTDYVNNYFDNGEGYDDDEDNLDEGPIY